MDYIIISKRLRDIKEEIARLKSLSHRNITDQINSLRMINVLLKEQNHLLILKNGYA